MPSSDPERAGGADEPDRGDHDDGSGNGREDDDQEDRPLISSRRLLLLGGAMLVLYLLANFVDVWLASSRSYDGDAPAAVVLGAAQYNGEPSDALRGRLDQAAGLYETGRVGLIVVTGGKQEADVTTEAKTGYDYLREQAGVPDEDLLLEVDGASTYMSLAATARFLQRDGIDKVILVTDPYHARRSQLVAEEVGLSAEVTPTDASASFTRLFRETGAVALGRVLGFRRFDAYLDL